MKYNNGNSDKDRPLAKNLLKAPKNYMTERPENDLQGGRVKDSLI